MREEDWEIWERELESFLPDRLYDAHCHLWRDNPWSSGTGLPTTVGYDLYRKEMDTIHPGREVSALFIPAPFKPEEMALNNEWVAQQIRDHPSCRAEFFIMPKDDPEWVREQVLRLGLHGFKCYHTHAAVTPTWEADIPDFLPEPIVKVAHEEGWFITLHMVKSRAAADPSNIHWIRHYCETYPDMKLILAHSARGFQPSHNLEGLPHLRGLSNLYFDSSVNCEPIAHEAIIRYFGHRRFLYGSDFPVSHLRGRSLGVADAFLWLGEESPVWNEKHLEIRPVLVGLEHLRSIKWACWSLKLGDSAVEDIFWNNAARLLGVS